MYSILSRPKAQALLMILPILFFLLMLCSSRYPLGLSSYINNESLAIIIKKEEYRERYDNNLWEAIDV